jgi:apolipoprotein N-acyltransferase
MQQYTKIPSILFCISSGVLLALSFPFTGGLFFVSFIAFVPLLLLEQKVSLEKHSLRKIFFYAYGCFFIYNTGTTWWIAYADIYGAALAFLANSLVMAFFFACFHIVQKNLTTKWRYLAFPFLWLSFEYMHYHWELSWPWLNLGNIFANQIYCIQWYEYTGVLGGTAWILIVNLLIFKLIKDKWCFNITFREQWNYLSILTIVLLFPIVFSIIRYINYHEIKKPIEIIVTQPNVEPYTEKFGTTALTLKEQLDRFLVPADSIISPHTAYVLAPETAIPYEMGEENFATSEVCAYLKKQVQKWPKASLYLGASTSKYYESKHSFASKKLIHGGFYESYNSSVLIQNDSSPHFVHKSKLVLGVEFIPFSKYLPWLENWALDMGGTSGSLGVANKIQNLGKNKQSFAPIVCYESIYGAYLAQFTHLGAKMIFIITNDGWWKDTPGYKQHFSFARLRAIETRRSIARSANTGISGFINQRGDILSQTHWDEQTALKSIINANSTTTFYAKFGDWIGYFSVLPALLFLGFALCSTVIRKTKK